MSAERTSVIGLLIAATDGEAIGIALGIALAFEYPEWAQAIKRVSFEGISEADLHAMAANIVALVPVEAQS